MRIAAHSRIRCSLRSAIGAAAVAAAALVFAVPASAGEDKDSSPSLKIRVEGEDGSRVSVDVATGWLGAILDAADIECEAGADRQARAMMESLAAQGEGGVYRFEDEDDGDRVLARRSRGALKIESTGRDGEVALIEMPWEAAQCLMMGVDPAGDLGRRIARGDAQLRVDVRDREGRVRISFE
ncbi:MAG: hypothetical protein F9K18_05675 [Thermoanaerobaculia bacterium]|nr:MAG: hypothetical protein F9K18_05675 [Thermoanaerobaculia bacterium]